MEIKFVDIVNLVEEIKKRTQAGHTFKKADQPKRLLMGFHDCKTNDTLTIRIADFKRTLPTDEQEKSAINAKIQALRGQ